MRSTVRTIAIVIAIGLASPPAWAAPSADAIRSLSLREAIDYARIHQPSLAAARARAQVAHDQAQLPRAAHAPKIVAAAEVDVGSANNTTASYANVPGLDIVRIGGTPADAASSFGPSASTLVAIGVRQEIYDFGRTSAQAAALDLIAHAADEQTQLESLDLALFVENSFYAVQGAHAVLQAAEAAVARATEHRDFARAGVSAQLRSPIELTRAQADLARLEVERVRAVGALSAAQSMLAIAIGDTATRVDAGTDDLSLPSPPLLDDAMRALDDHDPNLRAARDQLFAQRHVTSAIDAELRPDLSLSAGINGRAGGAPIDGRDTPTGQGWLPEVANWNALVVLSWPLFDRTVQVRADASRRQERVRTSEFDVVRQQTRAQVEQRYIDLELADAALPALQGSLDAARANEAQADARFKAGLGTAVELADGEALLTDAEIQLAIGHFQRSSARARLGRVIAEVIP